MQGHCPTRLSFTTLTGGPGGRLRAGAWLTAVLALGSVACNNSNLLQTNWSHKQDDTAKKLSPRSAAYLAGIPVPQGFDLSERVSDSYEGAGMRFARQEYVGYADAYAIREFYKEQMPLSGWQEITIQDIKGRTSIRFESSNEECTVTVEATGFFNRSRIQVIVKPFKRNVSEPPKRAMP